MSALLSLLRRTCHRAPLLGAALCLAAWSPARSALPDKPTEAMAALLTPLTLSPMAEWSQVLNDRLPPIFTLMETAEVQSPIGGEELLRKAYDTRRDIGPMRRMAASVSLCAAWREARALGMFTDNQKFQMRITRGSDTGNHALFSHIVPPDAAPQFACEFANVRIVAPSRAKKADADAQARDAAYVRTLNAIASEEQGMQSGARRQEDLWKSEMARNGEKALELPRIILFAPRLIATPSHRNGYKWVSQVEVINISLNATEVELECTFLGTTDKNRKNYIMGQEKRTLRLRSGQTEKLSFATPLSEGDYKQRTDDFERLSKDERGRSKAYYRGTIFRVQHAKGVAAAAATDPAMLKLLEPAADTRLVMLANLHLDPKTWPSGDYLR